VALDASKAKIGGTPAAEVSPAVEVAPASRVSPSSEVVAVMEEVPSAEPGGEPKRHLLGFLSGRGLRQPLAPPQLVIRRRRPTSHGRSLGVRRPGRSRQRQRTKQEAAPASESKLSEEPPEEEIASTNREDFLNGLGQWLASARKEGFKPAWVAPKYSETGTPGNAETGVGAGNSGTEPANPDFFAVKTGRAPFHVIDNGANQTHLLELEGRHSRSQTR